MQNYYTVLDMSKYKNNGAKYLEIGLAPVNLDWNIDKIPKPVVPDDQSFLEKYMLYVIVGGVVFVLLIIGLTYCCCCRASKKNRRTSSNRNYFGFNKGSGEAIKLDEEEVFNPMSL